MELRPLGRSGLKVSAVGLGCNNFGKVVDQAMAQKIVAKAVDLGVNFFDTSDVYGENPGDSETLLGKAVGTHRSKVLIATKFGLPVGKEWPLTGGSSRHYIMRAVEDSLRRLGTDYIDVYQVHNFDPATPMEETLRALDDLVRQGKARYLGLSNHPSWKVADAGWIAKMHGLAPFISSQSRHSVLTRKIEAELVPACQEHGLSILPFFPLESGVLTGKYTKGKKPPADSRVVTWNTPMIEAMFLNDDMLDRAEKLAAVAKETGGTLLDLAFGWLVSRPYVGSVIAGATRPEQIEANVKAAAWRPTADQLKRIDAISPPNGFNPF